MEYNGWNKTILTGPNATDNMVCSFDSPDKFPFFPTRAPPVTVHHITCLIPQVTKELSESGLNSATNMRWLWPGAEQIFVPGKDKCVLIALVILKLFLEQSCGNLDIIVCSLEIHK